MRVKEDGKGRDGEADGEGEERAGQHTWSTCQPLWRLCNVSFQEDSALLIADSLGHEIRHVVLVFSQCPTTTTQNTQVNEENRWNFRFRIQFQQQINLLATSIPSQCHTRLHICNVHATHTHHYSYHHASRHSRTITNSPSKMLVNTPTPPTLALFPASPFL